MARAVKLHPAPTRQLLTHFDACHRATFDVPAVIHGGKDAKLLAALWKSHPDHVQPLMARFFAERNEFVERCGFTVGIFCSQFARLLAGYLKDERRLIRESEDWFDVCKREHGGTCNGRYAHAQKMVPL